MPELPEVIDSTEEITAFLESISQTRATLVMTLSDKEVYTSTVVSLDDSSMHIDQLMPNSGNTLVPEGVPVEIQVTHEGVPHVFRCVPIEYSTDSEGYPYHRVSIPQQISALRKRASFRIPIKLSESPKIMVWLADNHRCEAWIENISNSGASLRLKGNRKEVDLKSVIGCEIQIVELEKLDCRAVVRHRHYLPKFDESRLGIEFWELPKAQAKILHGAIMKLQRHNIRTDLTL